MPAQTSIRTLLRRNADFRSLWLAQLVIFLLPGAAWAAGQLYLAGRLARHIAARRREEEEHAGVERELA